MSQFYAYTIAPSLRRLAINNLPFPWKRTDLIHEVNNLYVLDIPPDAWPDAVIMARFLSSGNNISTLSLNTSGMCFAEDTEVFTLPSLTTLIITFGSLSIIKLLGKASAPKLDHITFSQVDSGHWQMALDIQGIHRVPELVPRILQTLKSLETLIIPTNTSEWTSVLLSDTSAVPSPKHLDAGTVQQGLVAMRPQWPKAQVAVLWGTRQGPKRPLFGLAL
ncbi:hypothetical protein DFH07DRAFT_775756 [Mycena maculata]|uniref:Uncharacterized protein n=1 Tax=Mycena maculata TaxID=230809 RepID=A0AAD7ISA0_9AGAR|nr:hypothetical protein DFH07DRAFT_775756 [Mycena maculata]